MSKIGDSPGQQSAHPLDDDAPTTQVPVVRDDNPPTTKMPKIRDDNPPTTKVPVIRDDDAPTTVLQAITEETPPVVRNAAVKTSAASASQSKTLPDEKTAAAPAASVAVIENPSFVRIAASRRRSRHTAPVKTTDETTLVETAPSLGATSTEEGNSSDETAPSLAATSTEEGNPSGETAPSLAATPTEEGTSSDAAPAKAKGRRALVVALVVVLVVLLSGVGTLIGLTKSYEGKAKIGTKVAGVDVAGQAVADLVATAQSVGGNFDIATDFQGKQQTFGMADLGVTLDAQKTAQDALATGRLSWWPFRSVDVPLAYSYSTDQIQQTLTAAFLTDDQLPQDAVVTFDEGTGKYAASPDIGGLNIDPAPITAAIDTLARGDSIATVTLNTLNAAAAVQAPAAEQAAAAANAMLAQTYQFTSGNKSVTLAADQLSQFIKLTTDTAAGTIDVSVDATAVSASLPDILNAALARPPINEQDLYTPDGSREIAIQTWGQDGTVVADADASAAGAALVAAMGSGQSLSIGVTTVTKPYSVDKVMVGGAYDKPNGSKWIDINQSTFLVTLYEGTTQIRQILAVTGAPATPTHNGTFYIYLRYTTQTMRGYNADGTRYVSPDVPWVSYFNGSEALHGAPWRSSFGYRASHGCINLPVPEAKFIFDWAPLGTMVVVHN
ncbi:MAG: L,D-transpeptidase [Propionibacteriaceae bacterium]|nr:L,D-transpeptidase [Propionibacteriaceae bacterium]